MTSPTNSSPQVARYRAHSRRARALGPVMRVLLRPLIAAVPLTPWLLKRLYLVDLIGALLPLPRGATASRRNFNDFEAELVAAPGVPTDSEALILYFHGGGFVAGGLRTHRRLVARISATAGVPVLQVHYRQLPVALLSETLEDCVGVYRELVAEGHPGDRIMLAGDSAGGYLAFAVAQRAIEEGLPRPCAIAALSPWIDLDGRHHADHRNAKRDAYIPAKLLARIGSLLPGQGDPLTPMLETDVSALPPALIQVGSTEVLRSDAELMSARLAKSGVPCVLQIWDRQVHVFQVLADLIPEGKAAIEEIGVFARRRLGPYRDQQSPQRDPQDRGTSAHSLKLPDENQDTSPREPPIESGRPASDQRRRS